MDVEKPFARRTRAPAYEAITTRFTAEERQIIERHARERGMVRSAFMRLAVGDYLQRLQHGKAA